MQTDAATSHTSNHCIRDNADDDHGLSSWWNQAIALDHPQCLVRLCETRLFPCGNMALTEAVRLGRRECEVALIEAVRLGSRGCVMVLHQAGIRLHFEHVWTAAEYGRVDILAYLDAQNIGGFNEDACAFAAQGAHLATLQWLRAHGCPWDASTCALAAHGGHLDALQWAHDNGCPWNSRTTCYAQKQGHTDCLAFARTHGCPELYEPFLGDCP
ncbi:ankyrin repeat protein [Pandoravirus inopinatum]|uniref:Ankyrin repeat protein n=1 Tax=Pandoravirus inopinatum TaxID=1605721 RepID=A0A0B5JCT2_9VIRU|nr:ankyrin repeat protein [Pandoravirus inopinatum]AJF97472.1 ankyrin repeat protein [Pandoravirus inopinatum]